MSTLQIIGGAMTAIGVLIIAIGIFLRNKTGNVSINDVHPDFPFTDHDKP